MLNGKDGSLRAVSTERYKAEFPDPKTPDSKVTEETRAFYLNGIIKEIITYKDSVACAIIQYREPRYSLRWFVFENGLDPKEFVLKKLKKYKLVMYGEVHFRKASWDFLQEVINDKGFPERTAVIFMEMASDKQQDIDRFLVNDTIDRELLLNVFRDYIFDGWNDKGKFDFIVDVRRLNKKLPSEKKIRIIAVDTPRPFSTFLSKEDMTKNDTLDRNVFMAEKILNYPGSKNDKRNALFIVGTGHLCKTCESGDLPVAFELKNSPFGKEPFDGLYYDGSGTYQDNYDGYIFLGSLDKEPNGELLPDFYSDRFIKEMNRRLSFYGTTLMDEWKLKEASKDAINDFLLKERPKTRWENIIKPMQGGKIVE